MVVVALVGVCVGIGVVELAGGCVVVVALVGVCVGEGPEVALPVGSVGVVGSGGAPSELSPPNGGIVTPPGGSVGGVCVGVCV